MLLQNSQLNSFDGCTTRQGDLLIGSRDCSQQCEVTSLNSLGRLQTIQGSLIISCCPNLITIDGLNDLRTVDSIDLYFNTNLTTISGFATIVTVGSYVRISQNPSLVTLSGFSALLSIGSYLEIDRNPALTTVAGLNSISSIRGNNLLSGNALTIVYNPALIDLSFLATLTRITYGTVRIEGNTALCYAGYPQWGGDGQFNGKTGSASDDQGLDWRPYLTTSNNPWQYTWGVDGGYPTLVIQNNAPPGSCGEFLCILYRKLLFVTLSECHTHTCTHICPCKSVHAAHTHTRAHTQELPLATHLAWPMRAVLVLTIPTLVETVKQ